ncbi:MAG: dockerin type I domain-containing protein, partial [Usitatibacteraceae bacterium]
LVFQFLVPITPPGTVGVVDAVTLLPVSGATSTASGDDIIVTLPTLADNKRVTFTLDGVNGLVAPMSATIGFLVGDANNTRSVNSSDISGVKARSGQATDATNFKFDVNVSGSVNSSDISAIKARSGLVLPP